MEMNGLGTCLISVDHNQRRYQFGSAGHVHASISTRRTSIPMHMHAVNDRFTTKTAIRANCSDFRVIGVTLQPVHVWDLSRNFNHPTAPQSWLCNQVMRTSS